ncbi:MAG: OmpA family protein [Roseovarius sp.]|uniref:OmpA family protein n=1 Tax=Roseovarius sp. TaxID=1486281 RepID=UPI0032F00D75
MRLSSVFAIGGVFLTAAILCLVCARFAVSVVEETSRNSVRNTLDENGMTWTEVDANGLHVFLAGTAPTEARRFKALSIAGSVVDAARVIDQMLVQDTGQIAAPRFSMEILRNDSGVSLIGLVPAAMDREAFVGAVEAAVSGEPVANFLESADYPAPETWEAATDYALRSLKDLKRTKISLDAGQVSVTAMTESAAVKADMENKLARRVPEGLKLALNISAPRPVITPFTLRFVSEDGEARFDACSADTEAARDRIVAAAREAGLTGKVNCLVGMGVPTPNWAVAAEQAIGAVGELGGGVVTFSDADISLVALEGTPQGQFDNVVGALESALPEVFALHAVLPAPPEETTPETPEFTATLSPEGMVQLRGRIATAAERKLVDSFARARFTSDGVHMSARVAEGLPEGWTYRVLTALDALSYLTNGVVRVSPDEMHISGLTGQSGAGSAISGMFSEKLGEGAQYTIDVDYREELDPVASLPTPEECEARIATIQETRKISFEPGSANIDAAGSEIMDDIAEILKTCGEITMEIGGHTDSQGREVMNQQLSQERAQTVLNELRMRRVLTASISAVGYGETQPIADNDTEEGREANRRIEFRVILPVEIVEEQTTLESLEGTSEEQSDSDGAGSEADGAGEAEEGAADAAGSGDGETQEDTADEQD